MAVAISNSGFAAVSQAFNTQATVSCSSGGTNRVALLLLQLYPHAAAPTNATAIFDQGATNQAMTLIEFWSSGGVYHYMFGLIAPVAGSSPQCRALWSEGCAYCAHVSVWTGANQNSFSEAFVNPTHNTGSGTLMQLTVTSALNGVVVGHHNVVATSASPVDTILFEPAEFGLGGEIGWGSYMLNSSPNSTLQSTIPGGSWRSQGVFIAQFAAPTGHPTRKRFGGVTHAQVVKGKNTRVW